jgi:acetoin utilization deacetylase AcuC-like enzyme
MKSIAIFYPEGHEAHAEYRHPECPERVDVIRKALKKSGIWDESVQLEPLEVSLELLMSVHDIHYLECLEQASLSGQRIDLDTYTTSASWELAKRAAGGAIAISQFVWHQNVKRGFALTRPPGHHATVDRGMGFCLLNNVAIAAEHLIQSEGAIRLAIIDLDLHHGNGTQDIFWKRNDVLYISTHQYPHYPGTGKINEIGAGHGIGANANFPMPPMSGDIAYEAVMEEAIIPLLDRFAPEMILISYGFDTHWSDPLGHILLSADGYYKLIESLTIWADQHCSGKIAMFLEGGYNLDAAVACSQGVIAAMLGEPWNDTMGPSPQKEIITFREMLRQAKHMWGL